MKAHKQVKAMQMIQAVEEREVEASALRPSEQPHFFNREISWLEFNRRVLEEAQDSTQPLLEQLKFLSIFSTNLDEFFMIRVSGLKEQLEENIDELSPDGMTPDEQLRAISEHLRPIVAEQMRVLRKQVLPALEAHNIRIASFSELTLAEQEQLNRYFTEHVFPVLTPQAVDPSHPFPYISNRSLNIGVTVEPLEAAESEADFHQHGERRFARIKVPPVVNRLVKVDDANTKFVLLEEVITHNIKMLFPGMHVSGCWVFRVTRDADIEIEEDEADDLLRMMERFLHKRRFGLAVRLEVSAEMGSEMIDYLTHSLRLTPEDVYVIEGPLNIPDLMPLYKLNRPQLKDRPLAASTALVPVSFTENESIFETIKRTDVLVHHPYHSFSMVTNFIQTAARDADVLAIKMTLYRTGQQSPVVEALMDAAERGKQVTALVELKARFDEENNIEWARQLEKAGVHVVYGMLGLKTHCKIALVVRREEIGLRRYVHIGTGNYNPQTARLYTDLGLFTADEGIGRDVTELFNYLTGFSNQREYRRLLIAPIALREELEKLVRREIDHHRAGRAAHIILKTNSLTDTRLIGLLYEAAREGVPIDLIVRGVCMLRPGVPGLSETITVRSIVGRFLEHSRIFYFANGGTEDVYIGSADWMRRNLNRRVELVTPISDARIKQHLKRGVLDVYLRDNTKARQLQPDGTYTRVPPAEGEPAFNSQEYFARAY